MTSIYSGAWPLYIRELGRDLVGQILRKEPPRRRSAQHDRTVHRRVPGPAVGSIPVRLAGRYGRPQIYVPLDARRHGYGHGGNRTDPDLRSDRLERRDHPVLFANDSGPLLSCTASENTVPVPCEFAYAIWTSWQRSCDRDDQVLMQRGDRVGNVTLGPDRRRRGVGNYREWQVF